MKSAYTHKHKQRHDRLEKMNFPVLMTGKTLRSFDETLECDARESELELLKAFYKKSPDTPAQLNTHRDILSWCVYILSDSPVALRMIKEACNNGWHISISDHSGHDFHLNVDNKHIMLNSQGLSENALGRSDHFRNVLLISFARALRDVWQEKRHGGFEERYGPEQILMLERVRTADCDVISILIAWQLRGAGFEGLWRHLIGSDDGDVAMAFSGYLEHKPSALFDGSALKAAFIQWYRDEERINRCDHETLEYIDQTIAQSDAPNPFGKSKLSTIGVEVLSCMPDKTAYLQGFGNELLKDPHFAGLNDEINQLHMAQIIYDLKVTYVQDVPFRNAALAEKIFPNGLFTHQDFSRV